MTKSKVGWTTSTNAKNLTVKVTPLYRPPALPQPPPLTPPPPTTPFQIRKAEENILRHYTAAPVDHYKYCAI